MFPPDAPLQDVNLPWSLPLKIDISDHIGRSIWLHGLYDFLVCEVLWRLANPDSLAIDVGANIGQMTSILALRTGPKGHVIALEPHPDVYEHLLSNTVRFNEHPSLATVEAKNIALSSSTGVARLAWSERFEHNKGVAYITSSPDSGISTPCCKLDEILSGRPVSVVKVDVEGHELPVLRGGVNAIESGVVSNIVYEYHSPTSPEIHNFLESRGFSIFGLGWCYRGPVLIPYRVEPRELSSASNYLATRDPSQVKTRLAKGGWHVF